MIVILQSMKLFGLEINMNGNEVVEVILKGEKVEYAIARDHDKVWLDVRHNLTLDEILNESIQCDKYRNAKIIFRKNEFLENITDLNDFESNYEFLFGRTNFFYDAGGHFEKAYRVWKHAHNLEFKTFSKDEKVKFYSEQKDFCVYDVTNKITKEYQMNFIKEPITAYSELNTVSKFAKAWFESKRGKMEFNNPNDNIYFELFVFAVFKYGKLK